MTKFLFWSLAVLISGCAETSPMLRAKDSKSFFEDAVYKGETRILSVDNTGAEQYRAYQQAATGFISVQTCREEIEARADSFCKQQNKNLKVLQETVSTPSHAFGNFPRAELVFVCLAKSDKYDDLTKLKKLVDDKVITQNEFDAQKKQILDRQE